MNKKGKSKEGVVPGRPWGPDNPPPKSPGRPRANNPLDPLGDERRADPGVGDRLAAIRAAMKWRGGQPPKDATVKFYWELRKKNVREFGLVWDRLEKEREASRVEGSVPSGGGGDGAVVAEEVSEESDEELREAILELLGKHGIRVRELRVPTGEGGS